MIGKAGENNWFRVLEFLRTPGHFLEFMVSELRSSDRPGFRTSLSAWSKGFRKRSVLLYDLEGRSSLYMAPLRHSLRAAKINGAYDFFINHKLLSHFLLESCHDTPQPRLLGFTRNGRLNTPNGPVTKRPPESQLMHWLEERKKIVLKPIRKSGGRGFCCLTRDPAGYLKNGRETGTDEFRRLIIGAGDLIVTEFAEQAPFSEGLYPRTTNTLRLLTMWDYDSGLPFVAAAAFRIGSERSFPVDNWKQGMGGYSAEVDLETGVLSRGASLQSDGRLEWYESHPETGQPILGLELPRWQEIVRRILAGARHLAFAPLVAWDIVVTGEGLVVLEVNGKPGLALHQVHRPLLEIERIRRFYEYFGVVGPRS